MILSSKAVYIAGAVKRAPSGALHVVIADNKKQAYYLASDLDNFFLQENLFFFPATSEKSEYKKNTALLQRTAALSAITRWDKSPEVPKDGSYEIGVDLLKKEPVPSVIVVTYTEAVEEKVLRSRNIRESILSLRSGESLSHSVISDVLFEEGFRKVDFVTQPGEFALRGSLVDIYSFADEKPIRIDFFGDQIESIRHFNPDNQLSVGEAMQEISIYPNLDAIGQESEYVGFMEVLPRGTTLWDLRENILEKQDEGIVPQPAFAKNFEMLSDDIVRKQIEGYKVTILSPNESQTRRLKEILRSVKPQFLPLSLHEGYIDKVSHNCYYTDHQIFERYHKLSIRRQVERSQQMTISDLNALRIGDYVISEVSNEANERYILPPDVTVTVHAEKTVVAKFNNELKPVTDIPKTGDSTNMTLWAALAGVSLLGAGTAAFFTFRKKKEGLKMKTEWTNFLFVDNELGEEFFVAVKVIDDLEVMMAEAWDIANKYFPVPRYVGEYTDEEAEWMGLDTY